MEMRNNMLTNVLLMVAFIGLVAEACLSGNNIKSKISDLVITLITFNS